MKNTQNGFRAPRAYLGLAVYNAFISAAFVLGSLGQGWLIFLSPLILAGYITLPMGILVGLYRYVAEKNADPKYQYLMLAIVQALLLVIYIAVMAYVPAPAVVE